MYVYNLGQAFKEIAKAGCDKPAILFCDDASITFGELDVLSDKIANFLLGKKLGKNDVVAIQNDKTAFGFAAMLACLKIGAIYTNFDFSNPKERLEKIFITADPKMVLTDRKITEDVLSLCQERYIDYSDFSDDVFLSMITSQKSEISESILNNVTGDNPAYIMFTSGSTGVPKGVVIKHSSILNFVKWAEDTYSFSDDDILTNVNPIYFDNSVFDFYCSLFNGLTFVAFNKEVIAQPKKMLEIIDEKGCTFWFSVPSFLIYLMNIKLLSKDTFKTIKTISFGGEGYPKEALKKLYDLYSDRIKLFNVYGPTEGTCICSSYHIKDGDFAEEDRLITLGSIADNFDYIILDDDGNVSSIGELCLMGEQLALGYYNDIERTETSFVLNPHNNKYKQLMYKTGDIVEEKNGRLYFRGRADNQIKHMGYRIELEEIEASLIKIPYIKQCAVIHGKTDNGFSRIVAYVATNMEKDEKIVRGELKKYLPDYMIPNVFEFVEELPKNANGKVDKVHLKIISGLK